jgi:S-adenosylmethionine:tRNA ribosyltransferase-isomerase
VSAPAAPAARCEGPRAAGREVFARVAAERREAHEPPEARGLRRDEVRMLVAATGARGTHAQARDLPDYLRAGDILVVNTSKTLPAALPARRSDGTRLRLHLSTPAAGRETDRWVVELRRDGQRFSGARAGERLGLPRGASVTLLARYLAGVAQPARDLTADEGGPGTAQPARDLTAEEGGPRAAQPARDLAAHRGGPGAAQWRAGGAGAPGGTRLWLATIDTGDAPLGDYLARHGAPIRYAHTRGEHPLDDYQTIFALHPGSAEMPSAGRPFTPELVTALVARGIVIAPLTLHTGVSSLEAGEMPYPERFSVPPTTARLVNAARAGGGRVIAVGTTVVRALETVALPFGHVEAGEGWTRHVVTPAHGVRVVDCLLTGWHDPDASHLLMLEAIGGRDLVERSYAEALGAGYRWHEFGDVHLILP